MIRAGLTVFYQFDKNEDGEPRGEYWGEFDFVVIPRAGEMVDAYHDGSIQTVVVRRIDHSALEIPIAHPDMATWHKEPTIRIIADWRWAD
jgi:hypothetical protein